MISLVGLLGMMKSTQGDVLDMAGAGWVKSVCSLSSVISELMSTVQYCL